jgi:hypothetical protein
VSFRRYKLILNLFYFELRRKFDLNRVFNTKYKKIKKYE